MAAPKQTVTLGPAEIACIERLLADMRHNVNNSLALVVAASELLRVKPESAPRVLGSLMDQPQKVIDELRRFSEELERILKIKADDPPDSAA